MASSTTNSSQMFKQMYVGRSSACVAILLDVLSPAVESCLDPVEMSAGEGVLYLPAVACVAEALN